MGICYLYEIVAFLVVVVVS